MANPVTSSEYPSEVYGLVTKLALEVTFRNYWCFLPLTSPDPSLLATIVKDFRPNLTEYEDFYRHVHQNPEVSGLELETSDLVASHLRRLGFDVHINIGGHGVAGVLKNGPGRTILIRAELDALPILEQTDLPYKSTKRMIDRYGNERPVMHACGHDMNMAALLGASALLKSARERWSGTLITLFQPDEEETGGAQAMVDDGLYSKIPIPDIMLGQHVVPLKSGQVAVKSGEVLVAAESIHVRIIGGPCEGSINPQLCVDPIPLSMRIIAELEDFVHQELGHKNDVTVACWGFHAGLPGNDYVAFADFLLDVKTIDPEIRLRALDLVERKIRDDCRAAKTPKDPVFNYSVRAPLTKNDPDVTAQIQAIFSSYFGSDSVPMELTRACEDFSILGAKHDIPYTYWNFGGSATTKGEIATNHSPFFAPQCEPTLQAGTDAMALAILSFLAI
ncbi:metal-dependent amidase/aminoacylase/carboxypeptidase [Mytilinidion resinicola]|uniref:Metal-dependent amidase/aminoacylase/carboxypeptidase n=1 Tax=Mytilinidion resinicola TaxID=574789 RepID=A0A6A6YQB4_9PEZI|nr:metal-dependent amidase/aminoacylase/carboxypeptidase [Mytilinidion resinicola]KAF2810718.1 metal-dependent amidase/aminoacylase/carboxypeptidase [Mytilinidion resinicola]